MPIKPVVREGSVNATPNLNLETEAKRILHVLDETIARAKFGGLLPVLIQHKGFLLKTVVESGVASVVLQSLEKYESSFFDKNKTASGSSSRDSSQSSQGNLEKRDSQMTDTEISSHSVAGGSIESEGHESDLSDTSLSKIIYILEDIPEVIAWAKENEKQVIEYSLGIKMASYHDQKRVIANGYSHIKYSTLSRQVVNFIKSLKSFRNLMEVYLKETAEQYKARESFLRDTYEQNEKTKQEIEQLEEELVVTETGANVCLIGRNVLINRHQNKIAKIKLNCMEAIDKRVKESEKAMVNDWKNSMVTQEALKADLEEATTKYKNLVEENMENEKLLRSKRTKLENQILGWIQKFDQDMGEKQAEEEKIQALLDEETRQVNEIQQKLDEQEEEYDELIQEKAAYEEEMLDRTLYRFLVNRSVRRIQRSYRQYKAKKMAKKLAKKGKKTRRANKKKK